MNLRVLGLIAVLAASLAAQSTETVVSGARLGYNVVRLSDINGDGISEYVASRHNAIRLVPLTTSTYQYGSVILFDGATDVMIWERYGAVGLWAYGFGLGSADWNGDGILEVVAASQQGVTSVPVIDILDATNGNIIQTLTVPTGTPSGQVGTSIVGGDLDGDGFDEILVGVAPGGQFSGAAPVAPGQVLIYSTTSPVISLTSPERDFGRQVRITPDLDFDGLPDILVTAPVANSSIFPNAVQEVGLVESIGGQSLASIWQIRGTMANERLGSLVAVMPDLNGDGYPEVACTTARQGTLVAAQTLHLISGLGGLPHLSGPLPTTYFPTGNIIAVPDRDGDGSPELAVPGLNYGSLPYLALDLVSTSDLRLVDRVLTDSSSAAVINAQIDLPDTNGDGFPEIVYGRSEASLTTGLVGRVELRPALSVTADGNPLHDLLVVNGSNALPSRRVDLAIGQPFTIGVESDPTTASPTDFIVWGLIGVPNAGSIYNVTGGSFLFPPRIAAPSLPWLFTLTDSIGFDQSAAFPGFQAPWSIGAPFGISIPIDLCFQGVTISGGSITITNGILLSVR